MLMQKSDQQMTANKRKGKEISVQLFPKVKKVIYNLIQTRNEQKDLEQFKTKKSYDRKK